MRLYLEGFGRTSARYSYAIVDVETDRLVTEAQTVQVWYDYDAGRPVPLSEDTKAKLSAPVS